MKVSLPTDCGNAPRIEIVSDFTTAWAKGDTRAVAEWLTDDASWTVIGENSHEGPGAAEQVTPPFEATKMEIISVITHGRLASCDGYLEAGDKRVDFSHVFRFASTSKTAKIAELRSYLVPADGSVR